ncbi:MAG: hypothetical protein KAW88_04775 [Candidatus Cloacimonetes bacterium]|nr:hypothetical protein [Candidatus Cloacimonadota bacterium]
MKCIKIIFIAIIMIAGYSLIYADWDIYVTVYGTFCPGYEPGPYATIYAQFYPYLNPDDSQPFDGGNGQTYEFEDVFHWFSQDYARSFIVDGNWYASGTGPITQPISHVDIYLNSSNPEPYPDKVEPGE